MSDSAGPGPPRCTRRGAPGTRPRAPEAAAIAGYLGRGDRFDVAVSQFAMRYADQTIDDHGALTEAILDGRVSAVDESV